MMIPLCRHILPGGTLCQGAAVHDTNFCRHHQFVKTTLAQASQPVAYGAPPQLPFVFAEDRAANLMMVLKALNDGKIDSRTANSMNRLLNSCMRNLKAGPLVDPQAKDVAHIVIKTPDGEEIAPPREAPEDSEQSAALSTHQAAPHPLNVVIPSEAPEGSEVEGPAVSPAETSKADDSTNEDHEANNGPLTADDETMLADLFPNAIARYKAAHAARVQDALDAGLEPPVYEPWHLGKFESSSAQPNQKDRERAASAATAS